MFGIGSQELLIIGLLFLVIFGAGKASSMARDFGRFVNGANRSIEEVKSELLSEEDVKEVRRTAEEFKDETRRSVEGLKSEVGVGAESYETATSGSPPDDEDGAREPKERRQSSHKKEGPPTTAQTQA